MLVLLHLFACALAQLVPIAYLTVTGQTQVHFYGNVPFLFYSMLVLVHLLAGTGTTPEPLQSIWEELPGLLQHIHASCPEVLSGLAGIDQQLPWQAVCWAKQLVDHGAVQVSLQGQQAVQRGAGQQGSSLWVVVPLLSEVHQVGKAV